MKINVLAEANNIYEEIVSIRRTIHKHPEIGRKEFKTTALIKEKLAEYGVDKIEAPMETGAVALIYGSKETSENSNKPCVAIRADIDALPVNEETGLSFSSEVPNMMHACGHDLHASMLLGVAKILCENRNEFTGTVKLIFQPSEDTLPGGAKELVEKGVLENPHVDAIFGLHIMPDENSAGKIGIHSGSLTTSVDVFDITIKGKGGHGSTPHLTIDPILAACQMITLLQQIPASYIDPNETVIFPICTIHAGDAPNVIPDEVKFGGVARTYSNHIRGEMVGKVFDIASGIEKISGAEVDVNHYDGYPACYNDHELTEELTEGLKVSLGEENLLMLAEPASFSEDFSYYTEMGGIPGTFLFLTAGLGSLEEFIPLHNAKFSPKEEIMPYGIAAMTAATINYLEKHA